MSVDGPTTKAAKKAKSTDFLISTVEEFSAALACTWDRPGGHQKSGVGAPSATVRQRVQGGPECSAHCRHELEQRPQGQVRREEAKDLRPVTRVGPTGEHARRVGTDHSPTRGAPTPAARAPMEATDPTDNGEGVQGAGETPSPWRRGTGKKGVSKTLSPEWMLQRWPLTPPNGPGLRVPRSRGSSGYAPGLRTTPTRYLKAGGHAMPHATATEAGARNVAGPTITAEPGWPTAERLRTRDFHKSRRAHPTLTATLGAQVAGAPPRYAGECQGATGRHGGGDFLRKRPPWLRNSVGH